MVRGEEHPANSVDPTASTHLVEVPTNPAVVERAVYVSPITGQRSEASFSTVVSGRSRLPVNRKVNVPPAAVVSTPTVTTADSVVQPISIAIVAEGAVIEPDSSPPKETGEKAC